MILVFWVLPRKSLRQERWACKLPWWRSKGGLLLCVHESLSRQGCERFCVDFLGTINKQPPALICGGSSSLDQLSWGLILFSVLPINKVCFLYLFDLFSRLWVAHLAGMEFDFIMFAPLWATPQCGFFFVCGHRLSSFLVGYSVLLSMVIQQLAAILVLSPEEMTTCLSTESLYLFYLLRIYLAVLGLSCSMWDLVPWPVIEPKPPATGPQGSPHQSLL